MIADSVSKLECGIASDEVEEIGVLLRILSRMPPGPGKST